ncbi:PIR protein [Plasmodium ovale]|uniref:PIR protein n=2 Tax=Plasmodium ovale TaxID=36330 RepID=A0A1D3JDY5_PLAOA|nr:PIR protein [Plasmodium ovale]
MGTDDDLQEEAEEEEEFASGESYYYAVRSFFKYEKEFNTNNDETSYTEDYDAKCDSISQTHFPGTEFINRCYRVAKYIYDIKQNEDNKYERCKCLNYMLNSNINLNTFSNLNGQELFKAYKDIAKNMKTCELIIDYIDKTDLKKIEILYHLHKAMDKLENSIDADDGDICKNAEEFAKHYRNTRDDCTTDNNDGYCEELKGIQQYIYHSTKMEKYTEAWKILKTLIPNDGTSSIIVSFIMMLGIPFFLYILYKFTSLGSWVDIQMKNKKKVWNNIFENAPQLNSHIHEDVNMENSKFNIKYHSVKNS